MKKIKDRLLTVGWAYKLALKMNTKVFLVWTIISVFVAVLPAISVLYYKRLIAVMSNYISNGLGAFYDIVPSIIALGIVLILTGLSSRINGDLLYMIMYDNYHIGMQEMIMETVQNIDIKVLMSKEYNDEYKALLNRAGALTDFMSASCLLISKVIGIGSLLLVLLRISKTVFLMDIIYAVIVIFICLKFADNARLDMLKIREAERKLTYIQNAVITPGIAKELRIYGTKEEFLNQWENEYQKLDNINYKMEFWRSIISFMCALGFYIFIIFIVIYSIFKVYDGKMKVEDFLTLYLLGESMEKFISSFATIIQNADRGLFSLERQRKFILNVPKLNDHEDVKKLEEIISQEDCVFSADHLCFSYDDKQEVLHDISFSIHKGETIALVGSNGSGKSTLVKLLIDLYQPTKGTLKFYGKPYEDYKRNTISNNIGIFFQNFNIYHASLRENVGFGDINNINNYQMVKEAIQKGGASEFIKRKKIQLDQWLRRDVLQDGIILSGGEMQKVAVSRSYMNNKDILIFDEPAAALDPLAELEQFKAIKNKIDDKVAILISHRVGFARLADIIMVLEKGKLVESGSHEDLMKKNGVYANFFNQQAEWYDDISQSERNGEAETDSYQEEKEHG